MSIKIIINTNENFIYFFSLKHKLKLKFCFNKIRLKLIAKYNYIKNDLFHHNILANCLNII